MNIISSANQFGIAQLMQPEKEKRISVPVGKSENMTEQHKNVEKNWKRITKLLTNSRPNSQVSKITVEANKTHLQGGQTGFYTGNGSIPNVAWEMSYYVHRNRKRSLKQHIQ